MKSGFPPIHYVTLSANGYTVAMYDGQVIGIFTFVPGGHRPNTLFHTVTARDEMVAKLRELRRSHA